MKYFGKPVEVVQKRRIEYVTCDCCRKKIEKSEVYFHLYFNDNYYEGCTTEYREDLCKNCMPNRISEIVKEMNTFTCDLEINGAIYFDSSSDEYDSYYDKLVEEDNKND